MCVVRLITGIANDGANTRNGINGTVVILHGKTRIHDVTEQLDFAVGFNPVRLITIYEFDFSTKSA